jgi:hypothetical protein
MRSFSFCLKSKRMSRTTGSPRKWLRRWASIPRPPGYEPGELPDCSTPQNHPTRFWSRPQDSNLLPLSYQDSAHPYEPRLDGARGGNRTLGLTLTKGAIYQLIYDGRTGAGSDNRNHKPPGYESGVLPLELFPQMALAVGIEPTTCPLQMDGSTN